jgi:signal transduction histidine kinase/CheY-like chemotaxis protein
MITLLRVELRRDHDAVAARQAARHLARRLGFEHQDQIRIATAVSELARAALADGKAVAEFGVDAERGTARLVVSVTSERFGPSRAAQAGERVATDDGTIAARRLLDAYETDLPNTIALARPLPRGAFRTDHLEELRGELEQLALAELGYDAELHRQNLELSATLFELEKKQRELTRLNAELADTNRGVMALYAELDERANQLRQNDELKTRFFSSVSHELRTPLNSILALSKLLLAETDGRLSEEQHKQVRLIHDAAEGLHELVSDLLDLAKVEAGKSKVSIGRFSVADLFGALRGMVRPLLAEDAVSLVLEAPDDLIDLVGDEGKVGQVLRNFLSNAVKFTEAGSIRVAARSVCAGEPPAADQPPAPVESILFSVADTGIGIGASDQEVIFDEFTQVRNTLQRGVRGTGLGLPLCRRIATLLGGRIWVESELGVGSTFHFLLPRFYRPDFKAIGTVPREAEAGPGAGPKLPLLVLAHAEAHRSKAEALLEECGFAPVSAAAAEISGDYLEALRPRAAVVVREAPGHDEGRAIEKIRRAAIPLVTIDPPILEAPRAASHAAGGSASGSRTADESAAATSGARAARNARVAEAVYRAVIGTDLGRILLVDDDESFRTVLAKLVAPYCTAPLPLADPELALEMARAGEADALILDLMMPDLDGLTFLTRAREDAVARALPILVCSSKTLSAAERSVLGELGAAFVPKDALDSAGLARGLLEARARAPQSAGLTDRAGVEHG